MTECIICGLELTPYAKAIYGPRCITCGKNFENYREDES